MQLAVLSGGVRMPAVPVAEVQPAPAAPVVVEEAPVVVPAPYVAPVYPRKQDRN